MPLTPAHLMLMDIAFERGIQLFSHIMELLTTIRAMSEEEATAASKVERARSVELKDFFSKELTKEVE